jgi:uracil-DNA glycosylase
MEIKIEPSWKNLLCAEFERPYFKELTGYLREEYHHHAICPPGPFIFRAFDACPVDKVKVVIIGQDPYHTKGVANGLAFSANSGQRVPPSLINIYKEIHSDLGLPISQDPDLNRWAAQGVLLLNATLTVRQGAAGSHQNKGWEEFTNAAISKLATTQEHLVFILWGAYAQKKTSLIPSEKHLILQSAHPSPFSVDRGFFGNKHFSKTNDYLVTHGKSAINW